MESIEKRGNTYLIPCKNCNKINKVYHMNWEAITCGNCKIEIENDYGQSTYDNQGNTIQLSRSNIRWTTRPRTNRITKPINKLSCHRSAKKECYKSF